MDVFCEGVGNFLDCLNVSNGASDLQALFFKLALDIITVLLLGQSV